MTWKDPDDSEVPGLDIHCAQPEERYLIKNDSDHDATLDIFMT